MNPHPSCFHHTIYIKFYFWFKLNQWFNSINLSINISYIVKSVFKLQRIYTRENKGRLCSYQQLPPFKNIRASALCFAFFASNQIPFVLCTCPLSPECAFWAAQTCHNEDTEEFHTDWNQLLGQIICISTFASHGCAWAYQKSFLSPRLFFTNVGFSWKTDHYACVCLDHALAA